MDYYWELVISDGTTIDIPPNLVNEVKRRLTAHEPIHTKTRSVLYKEVENFRITAKPYGQPIGIEEVSQIFKEPLETTSKQHGVSYTGLASRWVKKKVPNDAWQKYYAPHAAYRKLESDDGLVTVAFILPVHQIDTSKVEYCSPDDISRLR